MRRRKADDRNHQTAGHIGQEENESRDSMPVKLAITSCLKVEVELGV
jgi:hypothetical protein